MDLSFKERWKHRLERLEEFTIDVAFDRRHGRIEKMYGGFLRGISQVFSGVVQTRVYLYKKRVLRDQPLGCLVVVVGNLTVGGTGKTPVVEKFARSLHERGRKVAILSRGYGSKKEPLYRRFFRWITHRQAPPPKVVSDGETVHLGADHAGDEPYMLARNLPGVAVVVDKNRVKAGEYAIRKFGVDTLLLDDGFQYLPLRGSLNLLMVDKNNPFGNQSLLPRGILREPVKHLQRASYVFLTKSNGEPDPELESLIRQHKPDAEIIECTHQPKFIQSVFKEDKHELDWLRGKRVASFSGIATPESFEKFLTELGAKIVYNRRFLDHHRFTPWEVENYFDEANEAQVDLVITTEKDSVRIKRDWVPEQAPFYYLRLEVEILEGVKDFDEAVSRICFPKAKVHTGTRSPFPVRKAG